MGSLIGGIIVVIFSVIGLIFWWGHFLDVLMGALPFLGLMGGAIAIFGGITSIKDRIAAQKEEERLKEEMEKEEEKEEEKGKEEKKEGEKKGGKKK